MADELRQFKFRRGTSAAWAAAGTVLAAGEPGYDTTLKRVKVGDGTTGWAALAWSDVAAADVARLEAAAESLEGATTPTDAVMATVAGTPGSAFGGILENKFARVLTPSAYGAKGDGIADDTTALQALLTDAREGDICELGGAGVIYNITATLLPKSGITIRSYGAAIRAASAVAGAQHIRIGSTVRGVTLDGLVFLAPLVALSDTGSVVRIDGPANRVTRSRFVAGTRWAVEVSGPTALDNTIEDNRADGCGIRYSANAASRTRCLRNVVVNSVNNSFSGVGNHPTLYNEDCIVAENIAIGSARFGIEDWQRCRRTILRDNYIETPANYGISAVGEATQITGNRIKNALGYGIEANAAGTRIHANHIVFLGTEPSGTGQGATGIMIDSVGPSTQVFGCVITDNYIGAAYFGINSTGTGLRGGSVSGNTIENWRTSGITVADASIVGNKLIQRIAREMTRTGVNIGAGNTVIGNTFTYEADAATGTGTDIALRPGTNATNAQVIGNVVSAPYAVSAFSSNGATPSGVSVISNTALGSAVFSYTALVQPRIFMNAGTVSNGNTDARMGFYFNAPVARQTAAAAATDAATTQSLVNDLRSKLITLGLLQA